MELTTLQTAVSIVAMIVLFMHGLQGFSREIQEVSKGAFQTMLTALTKTRYRGFALGVFATVLIQSSTAVTALTVALVDSGAITFRNSLGVLLGSNVGTTSTAFMVSFKLTGIGPYFIVLGTLTELLPIRARIFGKAVFYFGFVLFAMDLLSASLTPLRESDLLKSSLGASSSLQVAALIGFAVTAVVQSSSVVSGLAVLLTQQGAVAPAAAIAVVVGANVGTTLTSLIVSMRMGIAAKRAARANFLANFILACVMMPFLDVFARAMLSFGGDPSLSVALSHLTFSLMMAIPFLLLLRPFERLVVALVQERRK